MRGDQTTHEYGGHLTAPQRLVHHVAPAISSLDGGVQGEGLVLYTLSHS